MKNLGTARKNLRRDIAVAVACGAFAALMVGAAYAAVPLYSWFCRATGFAGTTQVSTQAPDRVLGRSMKVRFDANVMAGLPWRFEPEKTEMTVRIGEVVTAYYKVTNQAARETLGQASYNVAPLNVGSYFSKINCFCFTEQRMKAGETREMAVVFYVDPSIAKDADQNDLNSITLSYTFYPLREPSPPLADAGKPAGSRL